MGTLQVVPCFTQKFAFRKELVELSIELYLYDTTFSAPRLQRVARALIP